MVCVPVHTKRLQSSYSRACKFLSATCLHWGWNPPPRALSELTEPTLRCSVNMRAQLATCAWHDAFTGCLLRVCRVSRSFVKISLTVLLPPIPNSHKAAHTEILGFLIPTFLSSPPVHWQKATVSRRKVLLERLPAPIIEFLQPRSLSPAILLQERSSQSSQTYHLPIKHNTETF